MEETNLPITEKKGMSKGCIVGLVVVGVLIVLVLVGGFICYTQRDALVKFGLTTAVNGVKTHLAETPIEGVDTVTFNAVADGFMQKLDAEETIDPERIQSLGLQMQNIGQNVDNLTADQVNSFMQALIDYYPELKELVPDEMPVVDTAEAGMLEETTPVE